jgi:tetratricopeptide (TPR) repeat protein
MKRKLSSLVATLATGLLLSGAVSASSLGTLKSLLAKKKNSQAYALASKLMARHAGEPKFDMLYGLAAARSGNPRHAIFAFERVLLVQPGNHRARLELALANFMTKNYSAAQKAFLAVLKANPPKAVKRNILFFLKQIKFAIENPHQRTQMFMTINMRSGFDSNVNTATQDDVLNLPLFGSIQLSDDAQQLSSAFFDASVTPGFVVPLGKHTKLYANASYAARKNPIKSRFDTTNSSAGVGLVYELDKRNQIVLPLSVSSMYLQNVDGSFRHLFSSGVKVNHTADKLNRYGVFWELNNFSFPKSRAADSLLNLGGVSWTHRFATVPLIWVQRVYLGRDHARLSSMTINSRWLTGVEQRLNYYPRGKKYSPYARLEYQRSTYDTASPLISPRQRRNDSLIDLLLGTRYDLGRGWSADTHYRFTRALSNGTLYTYMRHMLIVGLDYTFK